MLTPFARLHGSLGLLLTTAFPLLTSALLSPSSRPLPVLSHPSKLALFMTEPPQATATEPSLLNLANGVQDFVDDYDVFLLDMWGVMHDGFTAYEGVIECVEKLRKSGKKLIILSNSSQRTEKSIQNLKGLGFDPINDFAQIITSGEVAFLFLSGADNLEEWDVLTKIKTENAKNDKDNKIFVLGTEPARDVPYVKSSGWKFAPIEEADLIIASGTFSVNDGQNEINKRRDPEAYEKALRESLEKGAARGIPMIVSNPDKIRPDYERPPMPGRIGDMYEKALIDSGLAEADAEAMVKRVGKPFRDVYDIALKDTTDKSRACMVGDALETDITGGAAAGIDTIWILKDGVYMPELEEADANGKTLLEGATEILQGFNGNKEATYAKGNPDQSPTVALPHFRWAETTSFQGAAVNHSAHSRNITRTCHPAVASEESELIREVSTQTTTRKKKPKAGLSKAKVSDKRKGQAKKVKIKGEPRNTKETKEATTTKKKKKTKKTLHWIENDDLALLDVANSATTKDPLHVRFKVRGNPLPLRRHRTSRGFMYNPSAPSQASFLNATLCILNSAVPHEWRNVNNTTSLPVFAADKALVVSILFRMKRPNTHFIGGKPGPGRMRETAPSETSQTRTDVDNLAKFVLDSLNGILYDDDRQVCSLHVTKLLDNDGDCKGSTEISCRVLEDCDLPALIGNTFGQPQ